MKLLPEINFYPTTLLSNIAEKNFKNPPYKVYLICNDAFPQFFLKFKMIYWLNFRIPLPEIHESSSVNI